MVRSMGTNSGFSSCSSEEEEEVSRNCEEEESEEEGASEEHDQDEDEETQGAFVSVASKRGASSLGNEGEGSACKRSSTSPSGTAVDGATEKLISPNNSKVEPTSWIDKALASIREADLHILHRRELQALPFPVQYLPRLQNVRSAAYALLNRADDAISSARIRQSFLEKKASEEKLSATLRKLKQSQSQCAAQVRLIQKARAETEKQIDLFQKEKEALTSSHKSEKEALETCHRHQERVLQRQLDEEKDKAICCVCHEKPRDTIILPCLHFQYCFSCLLRHREVNSNTCPTCRGPIQGLSMSSYLATQ